MPEKSSGYGSVEGSVNNSSCFGKIEGWISSVPISGTSASIDSITLLNSSSGVGCSCCSCEGSCERLEQPDNKREAVNAAT